MLRIPMLDTSWHGSRTRVAMISGIITFALGCGKRDVDPVSTPARDPAGGSFTAAGASDAAMSSNVSDAQPSAAIDGSTSQAESGGALRVTRLGQPFIAKVAQALVRTGAVHVFDFAATCDVHADWPKDSHYLWFRVDLRKRGVTQIVDGDEALLYLVLGNGGHNPEDRLTGIVEVLEPAASGVVKLRIDLHSRKGSHALGELTAHDCEY